MRCVEKSPKHAGRARWPLMMWCACAVLCVTTLTPADLHAETTLSAGERTRRHALLTRANELWVAQDYEAALRLYEQAQAIHPHPDVLYRIGQSHEKLGHDKIAADSYEAYLASVPDNPHAERIGAHVNTLRQSDRIAPPMLRVVTFPSGATILLDGQPLDGVSPYEVASTPGNHVLTVRLEGHLDQEESIRLVPGERIDREYKLEPLVEPEPEPEFEPEPEPEPEPQSDADKYKTPQEITARHVDISPPLSLKILGHVVMIPGTFLLVVGSLGITADGAASLDVWGPILLGGAAGVGIGSYILFIRDWKPRVKRSSLPAPDTYGVQYHPSLPLRRAVAGTQGGFRGFNLKLHF